MSEVCTYGVTEEEGTRRLSAVTKHQREHTHELTTKSLMYMCLLCPCLRGRPFDSWGGGAMVFCEKKNCSANFGK